jgi:DNA modification methylase
VTPYYERGGVRVYLGDSLEMLNSLPVEPVAAFVTDPPYSSGNLPESMKQKAPPRLRGWQWADKVMVTDQLSTLGFVWLVRALCLEARERLMSGGSVLVFIDWRNWGNLAGAVESSGFRVNNMVVWDKTSFGMGNGFRNQHELILWASKGTPRVAAHDVPNVIRCPREDNELHQSPKPVPLMTDLLRVVAKPGELVIDPFCGSGSTLIAARNLGLRAIGLEVEERYAEITAKRLEHGDYAARSLATPLPLFEVPV